MRYGIATVCRKRLLVQTATMLWLPAIFFGLIARGSQAQTETDADAPIVLAHGILGFERWGPFQYFKGIEEYLESQGIETFVPAVAPYASVPARALQLEAAIDGYLSKTGHAKVHIIAHSMGGLDARYLISRLGFGDRVASLTTVSTPHRGSPAADVMLGQRPGIASAAREALTRALTGLGVKQFLESPLVVPVYHLSSGYLSEQFNPATPDDVRVRYYSYGGSSHWGAWGESADAISPFLSLSFLMIHRLAGANDGLVSTHSASWGKYRGTVEADHIDQVGILSLDLGKPRFDRFSFYLQLALQARGEAD